MKICLKCIQQVVIFHSGLWTGGPTDIPTPRATLLLWQKVKLQITSFFSFIWFYMVLATGKPFYPDPNRQLIPKTCVATKHLRFQKIRSAYIDYSVAVMSKMNRLHPPAKHVVEIKISFQVVLRPLQIREEAITCLESICY